MKVPKLSLGANQEEWKKSDDCGLIDTFAKMSSYTTKERIEKEKMGYIGYTSANSSLIHMLYIGLSIQH